MEMLEDYIISMKSNAKDVCDFSENDLCCKFKNNFHGNGGHFEISKPQKVVIHLCVKLSFFAVSMAMAGILKFPSLKTIQHFY
jgi:hypothetical protein